MRLQIGYWIAGIVALLAQPTAVDTAVLKRGERRRVRSKGRIELWRWRGEALRRRSQKVNIYQVCMASHRNKGGHDW